MSSSPDPFSGPKVIPRVAPSSLPEKSVAIVWYRNDLRVRDHDALRLANTADIIVPVFVFDTSKFGMKNASPWGFQRSGPFRTVFLIQAVKNLAQSLRIGGTDIVIRLGDPASEILDIVKTLMDADIGPVSIIAHKEKTWEEVQDENAVERGLAKFKEETGVQAEAHWVWGSTMHHIDDIPFNAGGVGLPKTFTAYRKLIENPEWTDVRSEIDMPERFKPFPLEAGLRSDPLPTLREDLKVRGLCDPHDYAFPEPRAVMDFIGGEKAGEEVMKEFIWDTRSIETYKETRNESGKRWNSSKFSPWLALGCISPRTVYWEIKKFEEQVVKNESTYWLIFELMTRDYFHWIACSAKSKLFARNGFTGPGADERSLWDIDLKAIKPIHRERLVKWIEGKTGVPIVDANMRELAATGFMSNRGRQNVASFLIHDLEFPDWRAGAEYFESVLIDHDVASNWGNWAYLAGVGSDPRGGRKFNVIKQSKQYDEDAWLLTRWCPELWDIPPPFIHEPHLLTEEDLAAFDVVKGETYPDPIVPLDQTPPVER